MVVYQQIDTGKGILRGFLHTVKSRTLMILYHGFTGNKCDHHFMFHTLSKACNHADIDVVRFDFIGSGDSDGTFNEMRIQEEIAQAECIFSHYANQYDEIILFGFSLGGVIASKVAANHADLVKKLVLLSPAVNFKEILKVMLENASKVENGYDLNGLMIADELIQEVETYDFVESISKFKNPVKIIHGDRDQFIPLHETIRYESYYQQLERVVVEGADHCYTSMQLSQKMMEEVLNFIKR